MRRQSMPTLYATYTTELLHIAHAGWGIGLHPTPVGVFYRLEKGAFFRGGPIRGWHWTPRLATALARLVREAQAHPFPASGRSS